MSLLSEVDDYLDKNDYIAIENLSNEKITYNNNKRQIIIYNDIDELFVIIYDLERFKINDKTIQSLEEFIEFIHNEK